MIKNNNDTRKRVYYMSCDNLKTEMPETVEMELWLRNPFWPPTISVPKHYVCCPLKVIHGALLSENGSYMNNCKCRKGWAEGAEKY